MANEASRIVLACAMIAVSQFTLSAVAETLMHRAENQVPVAIVRVERTADHTEIHLQTQAALEKVCFAPTGPNSPYLLANGQNYRYLGGDNVTACPQRRDYAAGDGRGAALRAISGGLQYVFAGVRRRETVG